MYIVQIPNHQIRTFCKHEIIGDKHYRVRRHKKYILNTPVKLGWFGLRTLPTKDETGKTTWPFWRERHLSGKQRGRPPPLVKLWVYCKQKVYAGVEPALPYLPALLWKACGSRHIFFIFFNFFHSIYKKVFITLN